MRPPFDFYSECYAGVIFDTERARFASERAPLHFLLQELQKEIPVSPLAPLAKGSWARSA